MARDLRLARGTGRIDKVNVCRSSCGWRSGSSRFMRVEMVLRSVLFARSKSIYGSTFFTIGVKGILRRTTFCPNRYICT